MGFAVSLYLFMGWEDGAMRVSILQRAPTQIRKLRKRLRLTLDQMADELGYTGAYRWTSAWRLEAGQRKPSGPVMKMLERMARMRSPRLRPASVRA